ncbi:aminoglycoside phosphotransferase [Brachybacterium endophyticum]|uniref:Aminoglycoside phosphotransferase n=1 Tax=Brachybacterium endophyticum TaxID=2182385 RepID=A0A2U2RGC4_9MICO|nr:macrolide 2'-phosphotransferase [Brachybacterium endophyticum]PWH04923.1 aminoglycoside phosphotransferase [Brachybacterium endophyticum]
MNTIEDALALARSHDLHLRRETATINDAGLDYRVVIAEDTEGLRWVLRQPRRRDVAEAMAEEARVLNLVAPVLATVNVAVPNWRLWCPDLIAYPALPGAPGLTLSAAGDPVWHMDPASPDYAVRLGQLLAQLHSITSTRAAAAGVETRTPDQVREEWRADISRVQQEFAVAPAMRESWENWLADKSCWPRKTTMTHGEIYPAHILMAEGGRFTGVLDWTTGRVDDPARDFATQYGTAGDGMLEVALEAYAGAGGHIYPGLRDQARHLWEAAPVGYALYALTTRNDNEMSTAATMLAAGI